MDVFNAALGGMLAQEFDLEEMYHNRNAARPFHLDDMELSENIYRGSAVRRHNTVFQA